MSCCYSYSFDHAGSRTLLSGKDTIALLLKCSWFEQAVDHSNCIFDLLPAAHNINKTSFVCNSAEGSNFRVIGVDQTIDKLWEKFKQVYIYSIRGRESTMWMFCVWVRERSTKVKQLLNVCLWWSFLSLVKITKEDLLCQKFTCKIFRGVKKLWKPLD